MAHSALKYHPAAVIVAAAEEDERTRASCLEDGVILRSEACMVQSLKKRNAQDEATIRSILAAINGS